MANAHSSAKHPQKNDAVLPRRCCCLPCALVIVLCVAAVFIFWPSDPDVKIVGLNVRKVKVHPIPPMSAVLWISVTVKVRNGDVYWMELSEVDVGLRYRGKKLGHVESEEWHVRGWGWCHVYGEIEFSKLPAPDVVHLVEDLAKGRAYFHAVAEVTGHLGLLVFSFPYTFKAIRSCDILVNTKNHTIVHQHCLHKD